MQCCRLVDKKNARRYDDCISYSMVSAKKVRWLLHERIAFSCPYKHCCKLTALTGASAVFMQTATLCLNAGREV